MTASKVRADHEQLAQITQNFNREGENTRKALQNIKQKMEVLQGGHWVGKGATKFYNEMNNAVLPSLSRLVLALEQAGRITQKISGLMRQAEDEAAGIFRANGGGVGGAVATAGGTSSGSASGSGQASGDFAGATTGGASGGSASGGGSSGGSSSAAQQQNPLLARDPKELFQDQYLTDLSKSKIDGADSKALHDALTEFAKNPKGASDELLQRIADARGRPFNEIKAEYQRFLKLAEQRDVNGVGKDPIVPLNEKRFPDFMGSTTQMRYGKVVGDALGVDPVFGSMLNPTGGIVGPDNGLFDGDSTAVGLHGIVHDAAGYLYNYHNAGPGYDYLGLEQRDTSSPLSGQRAGLQYWRDKVGDDWRSRGLQGLAEVGIPRYDVANSWVSNTLNKVKSIF